MDWLRSCYSTYMRFYTYDERPTLVHWYFVDDFTAMMNDPSPFRSANWLADPDLGDEVLGELPGADRPWRDGSQVGNADGSAWCGTPEQWHEGQPEPPDPPIETNAEDTPLCCPTIAPPPPKDPCANVQGQAQSIYLSHLEGPWGTLLNWVQLLEPFTPTRNASNPCLWEFTITYISEFGWTVYGSWNVVAGGALVVEIRMTDHVTFDEQWAVGTSSVPWDGSPGLVVALQPGSWPLPPVSTAGGSLVV